MAAGAPRGIRAFGIVVWWWWGGGATWWPSLGAREVGVVEQRGHVRPVLAAGGEGTSEEGLRLGRELARELELLRLRADVVRLHAHDLLLRRLAVEGGRRWNRFTLGRREASY